MTALHAWSRTLTLRWAAALLGAVVVVAVMATTAIDVPGRAVWTWPTVTVRIGLHLPSPAVSPTGGSRRGWPPGVEARARSPPAGGAR